MHNFIAGLMGFFVGVTSVFHGGAMPPANHPQTVVQANVSGTPATSSGAMRRGFGSRGFGRGVNIPVGEKPFFGTVTAVSGSILTIQTQPTIRMRPNAPTVTITPPPTQTLTINLDSSTKYTGGSQSDITTNTKVAGIGKTNSDGSLTALQISINPTIPTGFPRRGKMAPQQPNQ
ncbi:MAG TPA: hypothetical protein VMR41_03880 [Patescibacteria group bacterium]|nr:hypothetical protein [Patescibacteria group bacterium]